MVSLHKQLDLLKMIKSLAVEGHLQQQSDQRKSLLGLGLGIVIDYDLSHSLQKKPTSKHMHFLPNVFD